MFCSFGWTNWQIFFLMSFGLHRSYESPDLFQFHMLVAYMPRILEGNDGVSFLQPTSSKNVFFLLGPDEDKMM